MQKLPGYKARGYYKYSLIFVCPYRIYFTPLVLYYGFLRVTGPGLKFLFSNLNKPIHITRFVTWAVFSPFRSIIGLFLFFWKRRPSTSIIGDQFNSLGLLEFRRWINIVKKFFGKKIRGS